jgi:mannose-1-phosphate guanylyltransferase
MEKTDAACVVPAEIGWDDLGTWGAFARHMPKDKMGNAVHGTHIAVDSADCIVYGDKQSIATLGITGIAVIATDDAVLVMPKDKGEEVKSLVERIEEKGLTDLL